MMATEATVAKPVESHAASDSRLAPNYERESTSHNDDPNQRTVNGRPTIDDIEKKIHSVEGSVSGGSDTDASKTKDGQGHSRASSVKKPATFKAVSVNKTFLGAKGASVPSMSKPGEKGSMTASLVAPQITASSLSVSRPRLVAKTGSGSRDSIPRLAVNGSRPAAAPDPSAVWNKNRPTPAPEPKKLTDEELKKYGIHMATRLQSDDLHGQSNWADIDDDDDDWAPETVTWADGTKVTLPHPDETLSQAAGPSPTAAAPATAASVASTKEKPTSENPVSPGSQSTIAPPVKSSSVPSGKGLILKGGSTEKVTLVAKPPPPPAPAKSPWAPLPPIEKASPVAMDVVKQHSGSRYKDPISLQRTAHASQAPIQSQSHPPPREIAPDDFSRSSWRDSPNMTNRELYNSQSGRYEPVGDRRGSFRTESHGKPPAVLQRPHHGDRERERDHAPEPSPQHQTSQGPLVRRRGSSNVSGGSGYIQKVGKGYESGVLPPPEIFNARRGSLTGSTDSPVSPRNFSPSGQHGSRLQSGHGWPSRSSPSMTQALPHHGSGNAPADAKPGSGTRVGLEDQTVEYQKRLMREKREEAIRRRLEEDAKEEAAKQERIRQKLAAMGPAPERKSARRGTSNRDETVTTPPTSTAEPSDAGQAGQKEGLNTASQKADCLTPDVARATSRDEASERSVACIQPGQSKSADRTQSNPWESSVQPAADRFTAWPCAGQQGTRNVWGSPNNDRGLGNGTFNHDLGRVSEAQPVVMSQTPAEGPAPIAPPSQSRLMVRTQPGQSRQSAQQVQTYPQSRGDGYGAASQRHFSETQSKWVSAVLQSDDVIREQQIKERAELDRRLAEQGLTYEQAQPTIKHTWRQERTATLEPGPKGSCVELAASKSSTNPDGPSLDSAPSTSLGVNRSHSGTAGMVDTTPLLPPSGSATSTQARPSRFFPPKNVHLESQLQTEYDRSPSPPPPTMAGHPAYDGDVTHPHVSLPRPQPIVKLPPASGAGPSGSGMSASPSGPSWGPKKPDPSFAWAGQSAYRGTHMGPTAIAAHPSHGTHASYAGHVHVHGGHQGSTGHPVLQTNAVHSQAEWQEKIYELTGRRGGPPKSPVVESASKSALDQTLRLDSATVSFPSFLPGHYFLIPDSARDFTGAVSKPMAEECFEEQEMGSLPSVRIPHKAPEAGWRPAITPKPLPRRFIVDACSADHCDAIVTPNSSVRVSLPGLEPKMLAWARGSLRGSYRSSGQGDYGVHAGQGSQGVQGRVPRSRGSKASYRDTKREAASPYANDGANNSVSSPPSNRGRSGYRGRSVGDWPRRAGPPSSSSNL